MGQQLFSSKVFSTRVLIYFCFIFFGWGVGFELCLRYFAVICLRFSFKVHFRGDSEGDFVACEVRCFGCFNGGFARSRPPAAAFSAKRSFAERRGHTRREGPGRTEKNRGVGGWVVFPRKNMEQTNQTTTLGFAWFC